MRNLALVVSGFFCATGGLIFLPLPTPFGIPLLVTGAAFILAGSETARRLLRRQRESNTRLHGWLKRAEVYLPRFLRHPLRRTHPNRH